MLKWNDDLGACSYKAQKFVQVLARRWAKRFLPVISNRKQMV